MPKTLRILLIEDDAYFRADIAAKLRTYGEIRQTGDAEAAARLLADEKFDVAFIDLRLGSADAGLDLVRLAVARGVCPIVLTGNEDPRMIASAYELGCKHYFSKLDVQADLDRQVGYYLRSLAEDEAESIFAREFVSRDPKLLQNLDRVRSRNLNRDQRILLLGPTGVGKTKIAKLLHRMSEGTLENFVHLNLAEVPDNLVESVLFGHKRGAFTGATEDREGFLKKADKGTLFLDEIGSIPASVQKKLLKVLEEKEFTPLGSTVTLKSDFRLISATCEDMPRLIESKRFRIDLYFRIKGIEIWIPPLRERRSDIPALIEHFLRQGARRITFSEPALEALVNYDWHGNVRELEQLVRGFTASALGKVGLADLPLHVQKNERPFSPADEPKLYTRSIAGFIQKHGLRRFVQMIEREAFQEIYTRSGQNLTKTQQTLGVSKSAIYRIKEDSHATRS